MCNLVPLSLCVCTMSRFTHFSHLNSNKSSIDNIPEHQQNENENNHILLKLIIPFYCSFRLEWSRISILTRTKYFLTILTSGKDLFQFHCLYIIAAIGQFESRIPNNMLHDRVDTIKSIYIYVDLVECFCINSHALSRTLLSILLNMSYVALIFNMNPYFHFTCD